MKVSNNRCYYCVGAWLILVTRLSLSIAAQIPEESLENPWQAICRLTDPIVAVNNKSLDRVGLENSFSTLKRDATPFTEHEIVSLILLAGSIEQKSYDEQRLCSRLAAIRLADHCQDENESKMLEAATGAHFSRLDLTVLSAITILEWRFPESVSSIIHKVLLEPNEPGWLQEHTSWYLASLVVADGDQRQVERLEKRLAVLTSGQQPVKPEDFYKGGVRYDDELKRKATRHWTMVRAIEDAIEVERVCREFAPEKQPLFRDFYRRLVQALACRPTGFRGYDEEFRRAADIMMKSDHDPEFYSLFFTKISQSNSATHLVQQLYLASETRFDLAILEKAAQQKDQKGYWAAGILAAWRRRSADVK